MRMSWAEVNEVCRENMLPQLPARKVWAAALEIASALIAGHHAHILLGPAIDRYALLARQGDRLGDRKV